MADGNLTSMRLLQGSAQVHETRLVYDEENRLAHMENEVPGAPTRWTSSMTLKALGSSGC